MSVIGIRSAFRGSLAASELMTKRASRELAWRFRRPALYINKVMASLPFASFRRGDGWSQAA
jgi:hypothetical protein